MSTADDDDGRGWGEGGGRDGAREDADVFLADLRAVSVVSKVGMEKGGRCTPQKKCRMKMTRTRCVASELTKRLLNGREVPSAAKTGTPAAVDSSAAIGLSLEAGSENSPVASTLSSGIEGVSVESLMG